MPPGGAQGVMGMVVQLGMVSALRAGRWGELACPAGPALLVDTEGSLGVQPPAGVDLSLRCAGVQGLPLILTPPPTLREGCLTVPGS